MKVRPMLGDFEIHGLESIESAERRALVEHEVPGLEGSYFQDLGSSPTRIVIHGSKHGDDPRDEFLEGIRELYNAGEPTSFVADILTGTDLTQVVIEELEVAEIGGAVDAFRYRIALRRYVEPPEPVAAGLLDAGILDEALSLTDAFDLIDQFGSIPDLGDPTPPVREAMDQVESATGDLDGVVAELENLFDPEAAAAAGAGPGAPSPPSPQEIERALASPGVAPEARGGLEALAANPATTGTARSLVSGINEGRLAGLQQGDSDAARALAAALGLAPGELVPAGEDAALVLAPVEPLDAAPTIVVRPAAQSDPQRLASALERVGRTFDLFERGELGPCSAPNAIALPNLVPATFCQTGGPGSAVATPSTVTYLRFERYGFDQANVQAHHTAAIERIAHLLIDSQASDPITTVRLVGHTDSTGDDDYNQSLGQRRADGVKAALIAELDRLSPGSSAKVTIVAESQGEKEPLVSNDTPEGQARNRRVEVELAGTCQAFFSQLDLRTLPGDPIFGVDAHPAMTAAEKKARTDDVDTVIDELRKRHRDRACAALKDTVPKAAPAPQSSEAATRRISTVLIDAYKEYFPAEEDGIDFESLQVCFERFANGELRNPSPPPRAAKGIGEPNSGAYFLFAEFAFLCIDSGIDREVWRQAQRIFVKTEEIFMHVYRPPPTEKPPAVGAALPALRSDGSRLRPLRSFDAEHFNATGRSDGPRKAALRKKYASLDDAALRKAARDNLRRAQLMEPPDDEPTPDDGCPGGAVGPGGPEPKAIDPNDPELQLDPSDPVDEGARRSLRRMLLRADDPPQQRDAARLIRGVKDKTLAGIFGDDLGKAVEVARSHGTERWLLVPTGEDAALVLNKTDPDAAPPTVIFRGDTPNIRNLPERIDPALRKASRTFEVWTEGRLVTCPGAADDQPVPNAVPAPRCERPKTTVTLEVVEEAPPEAASGGASALVPALSGDGGGGVAAPLSGDLTLRVGDMATIRATADPAAAPGTFQYQWSVPGAAPARVDAASPAPQHPNEAMITALREGRTQVTATFAGADGARSTGTGTVTVASPAQAQSPCAAGDSVATLTTHRLARAARAQILAPGPIVSLRATAPPGGTVPPFPSGTLVIIPFETSDFPRNPAVDVTYLTRMFFGSGLVHLGRSGSVKAYFEENSWGRFSPTNGAVTDWVTLPKKLADFGPIAGPQLLRAVLERANVNWGSLDTNGDGVITRDEAMIVYLVPNADSALTRGFAHTRGPTPITVGTPTGQFQFNAKFVQFSLVEAADPNSSVNPIRTLSTVCHELIHAWFDVPDRRPAVPPNPNIPGTGAYDIMSQDRQFRHLNIHDKVKIGWIDPPVIYGHRGGCLELPASEAAPAAVALVSPDRPGQEAGAAEYWLVENRHQPSSAGNFDAGLPESGLAIWHVETGVLARGHDRVRLVDFAQPDQDPNGYLNPGATALFKLDGLNPTRQLFVLGGNKSFCVVRRVSATGATMFVEL